MSKHSKRAHIQNAEREAQRSETGKGRETCQERQTFKKLQEQYGEFSRKRPRYIKYGLLSIFIIPIVFLVLMFSLESKLVFLTLWIISIIAFAVFLIVVEYKDYWYRKLLGLDKEPDSGGKDEHEGPQPLVGPERREPEAGSERNGARPPENTKAGDREKQGGVIAGVGPEHSPEESKESSCTQGETKA